MLRRLFSRAPQQPDVSSWWAEANRLADAPTADGAASLRASMLDEAAWPDQAEAQQEMADAIDALLTLTAGQVLPVVATQHRVMGADTCHHLAPAALVDPPDGGGKLFVTSARLIYAAGSAQHWPWHLVTRVRRVERELVVELKARPPVGIRLNTYTDAVVIGAIAASLIGKTTPNQP